MKTYRVEMPGNDDFDFIIGKEHKRYGEVLDIKETMDVLSYDGDSYPSSYICVIKIIFRDQEIILNASNPLIVIYREENQ